MSNTPKHDALGDRMKKSYEDRTRFFLPRRTYTILRVDGRAFHTWTKGLTKPYDKDFIACMDAAAIALCKEVAGAKMAFVQSDEISLLATDFEEVSSQSWFDGNIQKWVSVGASIATAAFNQEVSKRVATDDDANAPVNKFSRKLPNAVFDARVFSIPDYIEVENYFVWRQQDAARNSVTLLASAYASHKKLHGKSTADRHEIIHEAGDNWAKHPVRFKHGGVIRRMSSLDIETYGLTQRSPAEPVVRTEWQMDEKTPTFTKNKNYLRNMIPRHWENDIQTEKE